MKYLDEYKIFENKEDIDAICKKYDIHDYTINNDGSIDVDNNVILYNCNLTSLPLRFNRVSGSFHCSTNKLTSLEGCPKYIGGNFNCSFNKLTSLEGSPKYIGGEFDCEGNNITSLEGCSEYIGGGFFCYNNPIYSIVEYFIHSDSDHNMNNLIELFNYYDIVQDMNVIYDRLIYFYEGIDFTFTEYLLKDVRKSGYKIIY